MLHIILNHRRLDDKTNALVFSLFFVNFICLELDALGPVGRKFTEFREW